jgi:predicted Zn-dependent protease
VKRLTFSIALIVFAASAAQAQIGDILRRVDPNKVVKGAKVAKAATADATPEQELEIGKTVAGRVLYNYHLSSNQKLQDYVTMVGMTLVPYSERKTETWHFAVIDGDVVNAFSTPGNFVFITTATLKEVASEAELAAILGHEIAHVDKKHILGEVKKGNVFTAGMELATDGRGGLSEAVTQKVAEIAYKKLFETGMSRGDELEADAEGLRLATAAGYRGDAFVTFLGKLNHVAKAKGSVTATHPEPEARIAALQKTGRATSTGVLLDVRYKKSLAAK